ncbi:MAG: cell division protein FtsA [Bacteroidales bacterium]|jgi:cell division protein FtsA|nr:cell division protein FtsA [Bacteroidales bacterium]MDD3701252.1 cell division protein FtsA [Bacteroidales bacterium]MDY0368382.1 cell division protein FtsA [Bacteroidales bacterium]
MSSSEIIVGLDVGTTKIACVVGRRNEHGKVEILGHGRADSIGVRRGIVSNIEETVASIRKAVEDASTRSGVEIKYVHVGIAGQHIRSLQHRGSLIRQERETEISRLEVEKLINDMYKLNMAPGEDIIKVIPQEFIVDGEPGIKQPVGMLGSKLEANFHVIIGQTAAAKNILKCVNRAGLEMVDMILEPIASASAVLNEEEKEAGVALVDIGGGTTDIALFYDNVIRYTAVIPFGGNIITEDIREGCSIIKRHAEAVKVKFGSTLPSLNREDVVISIPTAHQRPAKEISLKNLASIIEARMSEIIEQVYYEIQNSEFDRKLIAGIVLTGGGALLKHIDQYTAFKTGLDVRIGYPHLHLAKDTPQELASPMFATSIGLVIEGIHSYEHRRKMEQLQTEQDKATKAQLENIDDTPTKRGMGYLDKIKKLFERDLID